MSTFFEKLTSSRSKESDGNSTETDLGSMARRAPAPSSPSPAVEIEESETEIREEVVIAETIPASEKTEGPLEEEGELTVDIYDKDEAIVIQSTVAGVRPEDLEVSIASDMISIKGTRQPADQVSEDHYYYKELFWGTFARTVILPEEIDEHHTEAVLKHGLLTITMLKKKKGLAHAQKLKIKTV